jgi:succinate-semialdehyde dehydrogenase / glutarate-semialdehyde dehydrogenase
MKTVQLFIDGRWVDSADAETLVVTDPATGEPVSRVARADTSDAECAVAAAVSGFHAWRSRSARERSVVLRKAADLLEARSEEIARLITSEQGKPLAESRAELASSADVTRWFADEGQRVYGRVVPARRSGVLPVVLREPAGVVAAFTPWNYPVAQAVRKVAAALATGCSVVLKGAEEAPSSVAAMVAAFAEAGLPSGALNLVFGEPAKISGFLIPHRAVSVVTFTGSTAVGKSLSALAGAHMKRVTMELGGHAPAIVCADADVASAARLLASHKFHNAGQSCIAPTRILVEAPVRDEFVEHFVRAARDIQVGAGAEASVQMGPLANIRRQEAMRRLTEDAVRCGAVLLAGGEPAPSRGFFWQPTVLAQVPVHAAAMNEEPFGPVALVNSFNTLEDAIAEANRLPYGLAAYAFTRSQLGASRLAAEIEAGMVSINDYGLAYAEVPFNGIKDSGYGSEGGPEALESFLNTKFVSQTHL